MKNLKIYLSSFLVASSLSLTSCSSEDMDDLINPYEEASFYGKYGYSFERFLEKENIVDKKYIGYEALYYYETMISKPVYKNGKLTFENSWVRIDDINSHFGIARRVDVLYKFVSIDLDGDKPVVKELVVKDMKDITDEYKYMYKDDYITYKKSEPFYVNRGKILEKIR